MGKNPQITIGFEDEETEEEQEARYKEFMMLKRRLGSIAEDVEEMNKREYLNTPWPIRTLTDACNFVKNSCDHFRGK